MIQTIKKAFLALALVAAVGAAGEASAETLINGAGATFPYPLYSKWFSEYAKVDKSVKFNYQSIGSGGGIKQITAQTVDFGASDKFLSDAELKGAPGKLIHIPTVMGAVVVTYNLPGVPSGIKLNSEDLANIYLGKITKWNDPRIADDNKGVNLPAKPIIVVHRSDGSGTTSIFTDYLAGVNAEWAQKVGKGASVKWPVGLGGKGNEGIAGQIKTTPYSIGYVELAYAFENKLPYASLKNKAGVFVEPSIKSTSAAAAAAVKGMPADYRISLVNQPGKDAYPVVGFTWLLVYENQKDPAKGKKLVEFLNWSMTKGQKMAAPMLYAPLPESVVKMVQKTIKSIK
ncbi:phosphate ABC transporter substrate-binding protein PstS [Geomonas sp. Red69]|uniref:Phosphate-binding protein n=1 Tax=Geomonas diazotrophica TaxID=2843197 RepID=A0ABX8JBU2_9BACT|nr:MULTISPECIES: phosphate ABC transporter substrate-binding protein PstS [Geomonas]MBU5638164.1 phosphate ABC transporter substrate-binding protein PstS [Geomonas diazotrophica]QWV95884.1 phosphate ABC transporter substrate-binding protein PstS [Geomonas nitrogeniifigens]QXE84970.1 phosphate ABC transporter substrate-binding protein PstS [Geomonas nitrogeniifigens]